MPRNKQFTDVHKRLINALEKKFIAANPKTRPINWDSIQKKTWIDDNKRGLETFILGLTDGKGKPLGDESRKKYLFAVARFLEVIQGEKMYSKRFSQAGYNEYQSIQDREKEGTQSEREKESYISLPALEKIISDTQWIQDNRTSHFQYLLLNLMTKQPPLRANFYESVKFAKTEGDIKKDRGGNWLFVSKRAKKMYYWVGRDKITNTRNHMDEIPIEDEELKAVIRDSLARFPREFVFQRVNGEPYKYPPLLGLLQGAVGGVKMTFSMLRSAYVNDFYSKNPTVKAREMLAKKMRHTLGTAQQSYNKPELLGPKDNCEEKLEEMADVLRAKEVRVEQLTEAREERGRSWEIQRRNTLLKINQKGNTPRLATIQKYELKKERDKWI